MAEDRAADALRELMAAMGCKIEYDVAECSSCGVCGPHERVYWCNIHDAEENSDEAVCGYAKELLAALDLPALLAKAWDEGYAASDYEAYHLSTHGRTDNPYSAAPIGEGDR